MVDLIRDIVQDEIISHLDTSLKIVSIDDTQSNTQDITFCCLKWAKLYNYIMVDSFKYKIIEYLSEYSVRIDISLHPPLMLNSKVYIGTPLFFDGTYLTLQKEWLEFRDGNNPIREKDKLPFIWLVTPTDETFNRGDSSIERESNLNLWFVHWSDWTKLNEFRQSESVKPIFELVNEFVNVIERRTEIFETLNNYRTRDFPRWGTESKNGITQVIAGSTLSSVDVGLTATILDRMCKNKC